MAQQGVVDLTQVYKGPAEQEDPLRAEVDSLGKELGVDFNEFRNKGYSDQQILDKLDSIAGVSQKPSTPIPQQAYAGPGRGLGFMDIPQAVVGGIGRGVESAGYIAETAGAEGIGQTLKEAGQGIGKYGPQLSADDSMVRKMVVGGIESLPETLIPMARRPKGLAVTLFVNWLVKPFSMALLAWLFMQHLFSAWIDPDMAREYTAGLIILAAAPCTAMVFVWSYLTDGDPAYTLVQVALNDLIMLVAFAPIVMFLLGLSDIVVPYDTVILSVVLFVVVPLALGWVTRVQLIKRKGLAWFEGTFLPALAPVTITALLATLVIIFFQGQVIVSNPLHIVLSVPWALPLL